MRDVSLVLASMGGYWVWQREDEAVSLTSSALQESSPLLGKLSTTSRDFH